MAVYWLTFRIESNRDYDRRYMAVLEAVRQLTDTTWWTEPTSFVVFKSAADIDTIAASIESEMGPDDMALLGMPEFKSGRLIGASTDQDLFKLMPFVKKV